MEMLKERFNKALNEFCSYSPEEAATNNTRFEQLFTDTQKIGHLLISFLGSDSELLVPSILLFQKSLLKLKGESLLVPGTHDRLIKDAIKVCKEYALIELVDL